MQPELRPAWVLHVRPWRDSSALVDLFCLDQGVLRAVWRGARGRRAPQPQPFVPLLLALGGRGELATVHQAEVAGSAPRLHGNALFSGFYLNELLLRLMPQGEAQPLLFAAYQSVLQALADGQPLEPLLRQFEWQLLEALGYAFSLSHDTQEAPLQADGSYCWQAGEGLQPVAGQTSPQLFSGAGLLAFAAADWQHPQALPTAKRLMRLVLAGLLGDKPLHSRQLFLSLKESDRD